MSIARIKTGDEVVVISGEYAGKTGRNMNFLEVHYETLFYI